MASSTSQIPPPPPAWYAPQPHVHAAMLTGLHVRPPGCCHITHSSRTHLLELIILQLGEVVGQKLSRYHLGCTSTRSCQRRGGGERVEEEEEGEEGCRPPTVIPLCPDAGEEAGRGRAPWQSKVKGKRSGGTGVQQWSCRLVCDRHTLTAPSSRTHTHTQHKHTHWNTQAHTEAGSVCVSSLRAAGSLLALGRCSSSALEWWFCYTLPPPSTLIGWAGDVKERRGGWEGGASPTAVREGERGREGGRGGEVWAEGGSCSCMITCRRPSAQAARDFRQPAATSLTLPWHPEVDVQKDRAASWWCHPLSRITLLQHHTPAASHSCSIAASHANCVTRYP